MFICKFKIRSTLNNFVNPEYLEADEHDSIVWTNEDRAYIAELMNSGKHTLYVKADRIEYSICPNVPAYVEHI